MKKKKRGRERPQCGTIDAQQMFDFLHFLSSWFLYFYYVKHTSRFRLLYIDGASTIQAYSSYDMSLVIWLFVCVCCHLIQAVWWRSLLYILSISPGCFCRNIIRFIYPFDMKNQTGNQPKTHTLTHALQLHIHCDAWLWLSVIVHNCFPYHIQIYVQRSLTIQPSHIYLCLVRLLLLPLIFNSIFLLLPLWITLSVCVCVTFVLKFRCYFFSCILDYSPFYVCLICVVCAHDERNKTQKLCMRFWYFIVNLVGWLVGELCLCPRVNFCLVGLCMLFLCHRHHHHHHQSNWKFISFSLKLKARRREKNAIAMCFVHITVIVLPVGLFMFIVNGRNVYECEKERGSGRTHTS